MVVPRTLTQLLSATVLLVAVALTWVVADRYTAANPLLIALGICSAGVIAMLSLVRARSIFFLLVAVLPLEATLVVEAGFSITLAYMLTPLLLFALISQNERFPWQYTESKLTLAYLAVCALSLAVALMVESPNFQASGVMSMRASALRPFVQFGLIGLHLSFFLITLKYAAEESTLLKVVKLYVTIAVLLAAAGIYQTAAVALDLPLKDFTFAVGSAAEQTARYGETRFYSALIANFAPRGTFRESLHFSNYLCSVVPFLLTLTLYRKRLPQRWKLNIPTVALFLPAAALFLTLSRSGWAACVAGVLFVALFIPKHQALRIGAVILLLLVGTVAIFQASGLFESSTSIWDLIALRMNGDLLLADPRVEQGQILLQTWLAHPLLGVGIGNYGVFAAAALGSPLLISANSVFLAALVENGLVGFLLLTALPLLFLFRMWRLAPHVRDYAAYPYLVGIGAGIFAMTAQYFTFGDRPGFYYLFLLAIGYALIRHLKNDLHANTN